MLRELNAAWATFSILWTTGLAYITGVSFYQVATFSLHPLSSSLWLSGFTAFIIGAIVFLKTQPLPVARVAAKVSALCGTQCKTCALDTK